MVCNYCTIDSMLTIISTHSFLVIRIDRKYFLLKLRLIKIKMAN